ncbi:hypothetical protein COV24_02415 [candidate division WWE3 bacterium CG10_big_fil_rev_8_21_14_0_10_32_10]|uniref:Phosphoribosyltransferase domain-containing protein n=1 Tax=candidate division WWE3 bacterium CG10_big_fil_rev_8_21_14_0_10_32_10 TaxID=1975090 RepID=A0A2H0RAU5_UNCKA|nr:MAG: hypothetical protein COV24_02415 [candidate division WWE3 bacterium CG10_big_fil_rev_8_21_14_0_10_32_10]
MLKDYICEDCLNNIFFIYDPFCIFCQNVSIEGSTHYKCYTRYRPEKLITPFFYSGIVRSSIIKSKYSKKEYSLVLDLLKYLLVYKEQFNLHLLDDFVISAIPGDKKRYKKRGFNLPSLMGQSLSGYLQIPFKETLIKTKCTESLTGLSKDQRKKAVVNTYNVVPGSLPKNILLIDDVLTTGSTLLEGTKTLKRAGVSTVWCFALAYEALKNI